MSVTKKVKSRIHELGKGSSFSYASFKDLPFSAVAKVLSRLVQAGEIMRVKKGIYHYPKNTALGKSSPKAADILSLSDWASSLYSYAAGAAFAPYALGISTQVPFEKVLIGDSANRSVSILGTKYRTRIRPTKHLKKLSANEFYLLESIRSINHLPGTDVKNTISHIKTILITTNHKNMINAALHEPPRVRAVLGALLEDINTKEDLSRLKKSLNPLTEYKLNISNLLKTAKKWKIK